MDKHSRLYYMDIFRATGIILMVAGHVGFGTAFDKFIHAFHMPMFFFISGFLYSPKDITIKNFVLKKAKSLLLPYFSFGIFHTIINLRFNQSITPFLNLLTTNTLSMPIAGALWFLTALFFTDIFFFLLNRWNLKWLILPLALFGCTTSYIFPFTLPWALGPAFVGLGLYECGYLFKTHEKQLYFLLNLSPLSCVCLGSVTAVLIFLNGYINMRQETYAFIPLFWVNALLSVSVGISLSKIAEHFVRENWLGNCLSFIGKNSIIYVCLNQLAILILKPLAKRFPTPAYISNGLLLIGCLIFLHLSALLFTRTKLRFFIGK